MTARTAKSIKIVMVNSRFILILWCLICVQIYVFFLRNHKNKAKNAFLGLKMFENRDIVCKIREIMHFKHKIMYFEQWFVNLGVSLHQKKILMVKVYG